MSEKTLAALIRYVPFWLGVYVTTFVLACSMDLIDLHARWGRLMALASAVLNAYGIGGAIAFRPPRVPWSPERKEQESRARIMRGEPPLAGYEYLIPSRGPDLPAPPQIEKGVKDDAR